MTDVEEIKETVSVPRLSATVIPVRQSSTGNDIEVLMIERLRSLRVLPGFLAFPGGMLDVGDVSVANHWCASAYFPTSTVAGVLTDGLRSAFAWTQEAWVGSTGASFERVLLALLSAGMREVAEEIGVCPLQRDSWSSEELSALRSGVGDVWLQEAQQFALKPRVRYFGRRVTPPVLRYRFDAHFFVAAWQGEEEMRVSSTEVERAFWIAPKMLLERAESSAEKVLLAPPTADALLALSTIDRVEDLWTAPGMPEQVNDVARVEALRRLMQSS
ncbi:MAG: hypothetical protein OWT28_02495 [Firmicutes bacterium]|nr:hypothetical protein [Bacillota bacterium]